MGKPRIRCGCGVFRAVTGGLAVKTQAPVPVPSEPEPAPL